MASVRLTQEGRGGPNIQRVKGGGLLIFRGASRILEYGDFWICYVEMLFLLNIGWGPHSGRPTSLLLLVGVGGGGREGGSMTIR